MRWLNVFSSLKKFIPILFKYALMLKNSFFKYILKQKDKCYFQEMLQKL